MRKPKKDKYEQWEPCLFCDVKFVMHKRTQKFCSDAHRIRYHKKMREKIGGVVKEKEILSLECPQCHNLFTTTLKKQRFDSEECRLEYWTAYYKSMREQYAHV